MLTYFHSVHHQRNTHRPTLRLHSSFERPHRLQHRTKIICERSAMRSKKNRIGRKIKSSSSIGNNSNRTITVTEPNDSDSVNSFWTDGCLKIESPFLKDRRKKLIPRCLRVFFLSSSPKSFLLSLLGSRRKFPKSTFQITDEVVIWSFVSCAFCTEL